MRKIYFLILTVFSFLTSTYDSSGQTTVTIPAANTNSGSIRFPLGSWYGFERSAIIYTAAELGGVGGQVQSISFYVNSLSTPGNMVNVSIYLKTRTNTFSTTSTYASETTGATLVYGPTTIPSSGLTAGQWFTITLATPFFYPGSDNLEVILETNATGVGNEGQFAKQFRYNTQASNTLFQTWNADNTAPAGSGTLRVERPNIQLVVTEPPCAGPLTGGTTNSSTAASCPGTNFTLSVSGASIGSGLTYQWQSSPDGAVWTDISGATTASYTTTQTATTHYRRKSTCSGSDAFSTDLIVNAAPATPLPFTETFADFATTFPPSCWTRNNSTYVLGAGASAYGDGLGSVMFNFYNTSSTLELATSTFTSTPANYRLTFDHAYATFSGENDRLQILYSTDGGATYTSLITYDGGSSGPLNTGGSDFFPFTPTSTQWLSKGIALPAGTNRLLFRGISAFGNNLYLDNIKVAETPPCLPPDGVTVTGATTTTLTFEWPVSPTPPSAGYQWEVRTSGAGGSGATGLAASGSVGAGVLTATATGLTAGTRYNIYVRSNCGASVFSDWTLAVPGTTLCDAANVPYVQNFDGLLTPDNLPQCVTTQDFNGGGKWAIWTQGGEVTSTPPNAIRYEWNASIPANDWFFIRGLNLEAGKTYTLNFKYKASDGPDYVENLEVKYGTAPTAASMINPALFSETNISTNIADPFSQASVTFSPATNGVYYIGFHAFSDADQAFLYIDDISVEICPSVTNLVAISPTSATVEVSFTSTGNNFIVEYGGPGFTPGTGAAAGGGTIVTGTSSPITITGLTANTLYDVYVRQNCGGGEFSLNSKATVRTQCNPTNVPYTQDFNSSPSPGVPTCTSLQDLNGNPTWATAVAPPEWGFEQTVLFYEYVPNKPADDWFFLQGLNLTGGTTYQLDFKYGSMPGYPESMRVAYGTGASAALMTNTIVDYPSIEGNAAPPFAKLERTTFTPATSGVYYIGFHAYSAPDQFYLLLDSIKVKIRPLVDVGVPNLTNAPTCPVNDLVLKARLHNYNLLPLDFSANPITVTASITGAATQTLTTVVNTGTLAAGADLIVDLPAFTFNAGVYNITTSSSSPDDIETTNDGNTILLVVNSSPAAAVFTPANPAVCEGGTVLVSTQFTAPAPAPTDHPTVSSGTISLAIPDDDPAGITTTLNVTGVPATSTVTGIRVNFTATHTWNNDLVFNLRAPNGKILNLVNAKGGSGDGFTDVTISSTGSTALPTAATTPVTGTFRPDAITGVGPTGYLSNATSFAELYTVANGTWTLAIEDGAFGDFGTLTSWSITITYGTPNPVVTWTPITGLFTNAAATTAYTANANAPSVYAKPAATTTYTVTTTSPFGCPTTREVTVTVNPNPVINLGTLPSRICLSDTLVPLSASPVGGTWSGVGVSGNFLVPPATAVGTYTLSYQYTNNLGCTSVASTPAKIEDCPERVRLLRDDAVILFPNPNNGQFNIRINSTLYNKLIMTVYTSSGLVATKQQFNGLAYGRVIPIDLTTLPSGSYMVQFYYEGGPRTSEKTFKVIIGR